jgi:hypothetical protein
MSTTPADFDAFFQGFLVCLLWSTHDDEQENLDTNFDLADIAAPTMAGLRSQCLDFFTANANDLQAVIDGAVDYTFDTAGHDFALSRNGHGAGYFDCDVEGPNERLQAAAQAVGPAQAYVGDDGEVHVVGLERFGQPASTRPRMSA